MNKINSVLQEVLERIEPPKEDVKYIEKYLKEFLAKLKDKIKKHKIDVEIFVGGSFARKTMIKKDNYDVDVFLRFDKKYGEEISKLTEKLIDKEGIKIHGSRDYFQIKVNPHFSIELIPVIKINKPSETKNITDLSYSHVKYINKKIKKQKELNDIKILKAFCYANKCYGAESYVRGFSGYALELLINQYKSFETFLKAIVKEKERIVVDTDKLYKNRQEILMDLNSSKLQSPIIIIDPTHKQRNAAAAVSKEVFGNLKKAGKEFLKNPSLKSFELKQDNLEKIKEQAEKKKLEFVKLEIKTEVQEGDIAGTKLLKFFKHLTGEIEKRFEIKNSGFEYYGVKEAEGFFVSGKRKEILFEGPFVKDGENIKRFKKEHKKTFVKKGKIFSKEKVKENLREFLRKWISKERRKIREMYVSEIKGI